MLDYYLSRGAEPVKCDVSSLNAKGYKVFKGSLQSYRKTASWSVLRHDPKRLSLAVSEINHYKEYKYVLVNDNVKKTADFIKKIIEYENILDLIKSKVESINIL